MIRWFIIVLFIKDVKLGYYILYSLQQWLKSILPPTSSLYWTSLSSKYKESNCISYKNDRPKNVIPYDSISFI